MAVPGGNLLIAQHRDTLRYARLRGGTTLPVLHRFNVGDYVYYRNTTGKTSLDAQAKPEILRVAEVRPGGVLMLEGRCGTKLSTHSTNCAPCHLPIYDHDIDPRLARPTTSHACEVCRFPDAEEWMLLCDACGAGWHTYCLHPPLSDIPDGTWVCPRCVSKGITVEQVEARAIRAPTASPELPYRLRSLQGAAVMKEAKGRRARSPKTLGVAEYAGRQGRRHYFTVRYGDGSEELLTVPDLKARLTSQPRLIEV